MDHSDNDFLHALETGAIPNHAFHHRDHLRAAWLYVRQRGVADAERAMLETIQHFASLHGHASKFHHTLTVLWVKLVAAHATHHVEATFDELLKLDARLLDKDLPLRFYTASVLFSESARARWVEPDVRALPSAG